MHFATLMGFKIMKLEFTDKITLLTGRKPLIEFVYGKSEQILMQEKY